MPKPFSPLPERKVPTVGGYLKLLDDAQLHSEVSTPGTDPIDINAEIVRERRLKNDNAEQDIQLKRKTLHRLFLFLTAESMLIFLFAFFQAIGSPSYFHLEDWSFKLLVAATIGQITAMLYVAVQYLFPKGKR